MQVESHRSRRSARNLSPYGRGERACGTVCELVGDLFASPLRRGEGRVRSLCNLKEDDMPFYQKLGELPRKHHIWFHRNGAGTGL